MTETPIQPRSRTDLIWLGVILSLMLPFYVLRATHTHWMGIDGGLYVEVARHVRDGLGLQSQLSLYNAGDGSFPHPTSIYPLWPLLLGTLARWVDLAWLSHALPVALSFVALGAGFLFGQRLWPDVLWPRWLPGFHAGHVIVLMLGLQRDFIWYSPLPFTEPLSWILVFLMLWRLLGAAPGPGRAIELGLWSLLAYLCRYQLIVVPIAAVMAHGLAVLFGANRRRALVEFVCNAAVVGLGLGLYWLRLADFVVNPNLGTLLRFDQNRASELLAPFDVVVDTHTLGALLLDRATGIIRAWDMTSQASYKHGFYVMHWALPLALPFLGLAGWRLVRAQGLAGLRAHLATPRALVWSMMLGVAAGGMASVHLAHKHFYGSWYFDERQSMICVLAFFLAMAWLLRQPQRLARWGAAGLLGASVVMGARKLVELSRVRDDPTSPYDGYADVVAWLQKTSAEAPIRVAMAGGALQRIAHRTRDVGYFWIDPEETSYADLLTMTDVLGAQYVMHQEKNAHLWRFREESAGAWERDFEVLPQRPNGYAILKRRAEAPPLDPRHPHVVLVGVDGLSASTIDKLVTTGELPNFQRLKRQGASTAALPTLDIGRAPAFWTTVATGRWPDGHGVRGYTERSATGQTVPISSRARKAPALWNVASAAGHELLVVDWPATWPDEAVWGQLRSDRAGLDPAAPPASPDDDFAAFTERDRENVGLVVQTLRADAPDLSLVHLRGPNPAQRCGLDSIEPAYRALDGYLGEILDAAGPDALVVVVSDHGVAPAPDDGGPRRAKPPCTQTQPTPGVLYLWGKDVRANLALTEVDPLDLAPTLAWVLGLPVAQDLKGHVLSDAFTLSFRAGRGREDVSSWGQRPAQVAPPDHPTDGVLMEQLRVLGYVR